MKLRRLLRPFIDCISRYSGLLTMYERRMRGRITILMHHRVLPDDQCKSYPLPSLVIPQSVFREEVAWLADNCHVLTIETALADLQAGNMPQDRPTICISFDDGYADNFLHAAPILREKDVRATFFVTSGLISERKRLWFDDAALLWETMPSDCWTTVARALSAEQVPSHGEFAPWATWLKEDLPSRLAAIRQQANTAIPVSDKFDLMTTEQVISLHAEGHEIGSHTRSHPVLPQISDDRLLSDEISGSRREIASWIGKAPTGFCFPNGDFDHRVMAIVKKAGYSYACTVGHGVVEQQSDRWQLERIDVNPIHVVRGSGRLDEIGFRCEISRLRSAWRGS